MAAQRPVTVLQQSLLETNPPIAEGAESVLKRITVAQENPIFPKTYSLRPRPLLTRAKTIRPDDPDTPVSPGCANRLFGRSVRRRSDSRDTSDAGSTNYAHVESVPAHSSLSAPEEGSVPATAAIRPDCQDSASDCSVELLHDDSENDSDDSVNIDNAINTSANTTTQVTTMPVVHEKDETVDVYSLNVAIQTPRRSSSFILHFRQQSYDGSEGSLQTRLIKEIENTRGKGYQGEMKGFVPIGQLQRHVSTNHVASQLRRLEAQNMKLLGRTVREACSNFNIARKPSLRREARKICGPEGMSFGPDSDGLSGRDMRRIFAILMLINKPGRIWALYNEGLRDNDLPLVLASVPAPKPGKPCGQRLARKGNDNEILGCFQTWKQETLKRFEEEQWRVLAPVFRFNPRNPKAMKPQIFEPDQILPFIGWKRIADSGNCEVFKVGIHPQHHNFGDFRESRVPADEHEFAIKRLKTQDPAQYESEVEILRRFNKHRHENRHLVPLLAAFQYRNSFHLVLPLAQSDLAQYWRENRDPKFDEETVKWFARQCRGLVKALGLVHRHSTSIHSSLPRGVHKVGHAKGEANAPTQTGDSPPSKRPTCSYGAKSKSRILLGRHGDIKPSNILWFRNPLYGSRRGTLMISDFGAANLAKELTQTSENVNFSPTYRPPEHDDADFFVDSFWDVWSLGCLFLEFATWILMGQEGVEEFSSKRIGPDSAWCPGIPTDSFFWQCEKKVGDEIQRVVEVRPAVSEWIDRLHRHEKCTELLHEFLNIITYDMLVVNSSERKAAGTIYKALSKRRRERREDWDWCMKPCPWIHPRSPPCQMQSPEEHH